jgi:serine/threonine protein kinase
MPFAPGTCLGPYEILAPIGAGGMGEVWKARDTRLNRIVAIKRLKPDSAARFQQEARAIAALCHPNICQIFDVGADFLVLEFVEGSPLQGPLSAAEALPLALEIASALEAAHKRGILHRDLKPANVLVTDGGTKLLDFGLAKMTGESDIDSTRTTEGTLLGTPAYMSPEQARGRELDARSDIFSFGALLYEVLSGRRAFTGDSILETLNAVVSSEPPPLESPLSSLVKKCLAKDASKRFQSAAELKAALANPPTKIENLQASIAVLPFVNMSGDKDQEYFSDGLAEEILNLLAKIPGLKVTARTSSFSFRGKEQDVRKIAHALSVKTILEGSVPFSSRGARCDTASAGANAPSPRSLLSATRSTSCCLLEKATCGRPVPKLVSTVSRTELRSLSKRTFAAHRRRLRTTMTAIPIRGPCGLLSENHFRGTAGGPQQDLPQRFGRCWPSSCDHAKDHVSLSCWLFAALFRNIGHYSAANQRVIVPSGIDASPARHNCARPVRHRSAGYGRLCRAHSIVS